MRRHLKLLIIQWLRDMKRLGSAFLAVMRGVLGVATLNTNNLDAHLGPFGALFPAFLPAFEGEIWGSTGKIGGKFGEIQGIIFC